MRLIARACLAFVFIALIETINVLAHSAGYIERLYGRLQQPRLTAGETRAATVAVTTGHDPPRIGGVRSIELRHEPRGSTPGKS